MQSDSKIKKVEGHLEYINDKLALVNMTPNHISIPCIPCKTKTYSLRSINQSHTSSITSGMTAQLQPNSDYDCGWVNCMTRLNTFLSNRKDTDTFKLIWNLLESYCDKFEGFRLGKPYEKPEEEKPGQETNTP